MAVRPIYQNRTQSIWTIPVQRQHVDCVKENTLAGKGSQYKFQQHIKEEGDNIAPPDLHAAMDAFTLSTSVYFSTKTSFTYRYIACCKQM
ncbi:hypothetical protein HCH_01826 [Hahella chejuensis KCTC 2396]|uniref:Uncharacterized protein n=1 Tax=Hahella chejuensis (strain KCTC 2396) TaxID=349521 RepID=Q2SL09_HAHCH|nr:hypothetical protein HCH_01826 [Hahella chejuensis KCTC 2396]